MLASILKKKIITFSRSKKVCSKQLADFPIHTLRGLTWPWEHVHTTCTPTHTPHSVSSHTHLCLLQTAFGNSTVGFRMFDSTGYGGTDLLFSDATHHLQRVLGSYTSWLGSTYTTMLQAFECEGELVCVCVCEVCLPALCVFSCVCPLQLFSLLLFPSTRLLLMEQEEDFQSIIIPLSPSFLPSCLPSLPSASLCLAVPPPLFPPLRVCFLPAFTTNSPLFHSCPPPTRWDISFTWQIRTSLTETSLKLNILKRHWGRECERESIK